jgi:hypothetical protein
MKFRVGVATTYHDEVEVEAETEEEALRIAREMNARGEVAISGGFSDVDYFVLEPMSHEIERTEKVSPAALGPVVIGTNWYEGFEQRSGKAVHDHFRRG